MRAALLDLQRRLGADGGVVVEGRDIGTVVFPSAEAKFFLTASPEERARRRVAELARRRKPVDDAATLAEIRERDERDSSRAAAPLRQAEDAVLVDSSDLSASTGVVVASAQRPCWRRPCAAPPRTRLTNPRMHGIPNAPRRYKGDTCGNRRERGKINPRA